MFKIVIVGYYGAKNFGDDLMLEGLLSQIGTKANISVLGFGSMNLKPDILKERHQLNFSSIRGGKKIKNKMKSIFKIVYELSNSSIVIFGGGTILFDNVSNGYKNLFGPLKIIILSIILNKKIGFYGCGIGELQSSYGKKIAKFILNACNFIYLRDNNSINKLKQLQINCNQKNIKLVKDPAFMAFFKKNKANREYQVICLIETNYRETGFFDESRMTDLLAIYVHCQIKKGKQIFLLPMQEDIHRNDNNVHFRLHNKLDKHLTNHLNVQQNLSYFEKKELLCSAESILSMRYHPLVVGKILGIKTLGLIVSEKCKNFATDHLYDYDHIDMRKKGWDKSFLKKLYDFGLAKTSESDVSTSLHANHEFKKIFPKIAC